MSHSERIDTSLGKRRHLARILRRIDEGGTVPDDLDEIGRTLGRSGNSALFPLLRRIRRERDALALGRCLYLLDFFREETWLPELIRITAERRDLGADGLRLLRTELARRGIDTEAPPFDGTPEGTDGSATPGFSDDSHREETGPVSFLDDFIGFSRDVQLTMVRRLAASADAEADLLLEILLGFCDREIVREVVAGLGRRRTDGSARILESYLANGDGIFRSLAQRSLRRLSFLGIATRPVAVRAPVPPFHLAAVSPVGGSGFRSLWFSRRDGDGGLHVLLLHLHETWGVMDAAEHGILNPGHHDELFQEAVREEDLIEVSPEYALRILRDALFRNRSNSYPLPPEFYIWRRFLRAEDASPAPYIPDFQSFNLEEISGSSRYLAAGATLLDEACFSGWFSASGRVFDFAEKLDVIGDGSPLSLQSAEMNALLGSFMGEVITPESDMIARRLFLIADLMLSTGAERELVELILAVAMSLVDGRLPHPQNPFLRRFALESLSMAREALAEGFDPRWHREEWDDGEQWD